ncbi:MAG: DUF2058 domain-containing protein [Gammaproteobacteria bacterium]|nr:DUF2058 domain-containing protein [Gammaproteobacteria bacterium]MCW8988488.1 DUF2058 domain-containing protein [Gammaproteobacteria bacterium]
MGNPFQDQLLKAGVVTKQQVKKAQSESNKKNKQQRSKKEKVVDENKLKAQQAAKEKAEHDRELNKRKEDQAKQKALSAEIDQLISQNYLKRDEDCDIVYNFEHRKKVNRLYVNKDMKQNIINGELGIARIEGRYELIPKVIAEKIQQRNEKRVILFEKEEQVIDKNDPYAEFQVPDDLVW